MKNIIKSLFSNDRKESDHSLTNTLDTISDVQISVPQDSSTHQLSVGYCQSVGKLRDHNEDALLALSTVLTTGEELSNFGLFIIADGMGGHQHGEIASEVAIRTLAGYVTRKVLTPILSPKSTQPQDSLQEIMREGMHEAHRVILHQAPGGGTTMTSLLLLGEQLTIAHVGDSRAYTINEDGSLQCLTRDHSLVNRLIELGQLTIEEAANHPQRNVLYRALGQSEPFEPDIQTLHLHQNRYLLICSDGLWGTISAADITRIICESTNPTLACQKLVDAANDAGGPDNISTILIRLPQ